MSKVCTLIETRHSCSKISARWLLNVNFYLIVFTPLHSNRSYANVRPLPRFPDGTLRGMLTRTKS